MEKPRKMAGSSFMSRSIDARSAAIMCVFCQCRLPCDAQNREQNRSGPVCTISML